MGLRSARPDLEVVVHAVDVSAEVVEIAEAGIYAPAMSAVVDPGIFHRLTGARCRTCSTGRRAWRRSKGWLREGIAWHVDDACDPQLGSRLGSQNIVVASNFLCHLEPSSAECCLRNIGRLVEPGGFLFASGVDLDVRTNVAHDLGGSQSLIYSRRFTTPIPRCQSLAVGVGRARAALSTPIGLGDVLRDRVPDQFEGECARGLHRPLGLAGAN